MSLPDTCLNWTPAFAGWIPILCHKPAYGYYREKSILIAQLKKSRRKSKLVLCIYCEQSLHETSLKCSANTQPEQPRHSKSSLGAFQRSQGQPAGLGAPHQWPARHLRSKPHWPHPFTNKPIPLSDYEVSNDSTLIKSSLLVCSRSDGLVTGQMYIPRSSCAFPSLAHMVSADLWLKVTITLALLMKGLLTQFNQNQKSAI